MESFKLPLCILVIIHVLLCIPPAAAEIRKINGQRALEFPLYRTKHPAQVLLEFAGNQAKAKHGKFNKSDFLHGLHKKLKYAAAVKNETIAIFKHFDTDFYAKIGIGDPARSFNMLVDTAWTDTWVVSVQCKNWTCHNKTKYNENASRTDHHDGSPFQVNLGNSAFGGNLTGILTIETMVFAHFNASNVTFALVDSIPWYMFFTRYDGILGMARKPTDRMKEKPLIWTELIRQNKITSKIFSLYYNREPSIPRAGAILIGAKDPHHYNSSTAEEVRVLGDYLWSFKIKDVIFSRIKKKEKREALLHFCKNSCVAQLDSGGNSIEGPAAQVEEIHQLIGAQPFFLGFHRVPCENIAKLPELYLTFGKKELVLYGEHYIQQIFYEGYALCLSTFWPNDASDSWSFGVPLMGKYYTIYNLDKGTVEITDYKTSPTDAPFNETITKRTVQEKVSPPKCND